MPPHASPTERIRQPSKSTSVQLRRLFITLNAWSVLFLFSFSYRTTRIDGVEKYDSFRPIPNHRKKSSDNFIRRELINSNYTEFCGDCRFSPTEMGMLTCLNRAQYLVDVYKLSEQAAIDAVLEDQPENCKIVRFNATNELLKVLHGGERGDDASMFHTGPRSESIVSSSHLVNLSIYVYDTIPHKIGSYVEETMSAIYASGNASLINFMADIAIINLFRTYSGRTYDHRSAQLFVVPYPQASHCLLEAHSGTPWKNQCTHVSGDMIEKEVFDNLPYYRGNETRHLFINTAEYWLVHPSLRNVPLSLNLGPRHQSETSKQIIVPYLNDKESFQPPFLKRFDVEWWTRPRKFSLAYFFGSSNKRMPSSQRVQRRYFLEEVRTNWSSSSLLGDLPYVVTTLHGHSIPSGGFMKNVYRNSIFCPTLPGDAPPQKRFFDVVMMGCIPVVLSFETDQQSVSKKSWHSINGSSIEDTYPWIEGSRVVDPTNEIDYESFVVEVTGGVENIKPVLEALLNNSKKIRRKQINLMKYASFFSYGMGENAHKYEDAFHKILQSLKFHLAI